MFLDHFALVGQTPQVAMHIDIANGGFGGPTAHGAGLDAGIEQPDPVPTREGNWQDAVERVFSRRRNAIAKGLQRWACVLEIGLRGRKLLRAGSV